MASISVKTVSGKSAGDVEVADDVFGIAPNVPVLHQVVTAQLAARRAGTQSTKTRAEVSGGGKKPFKQKGTGNARAGMVSSPLWRGGGRIFPNRPDENFEHKINRKMYRAGVCSILSQLAREGRLQV
ncbi:MAG: 50S ribosomal protein L4, partial [Ilumatobacteraceae bacterium]